MPSSTTVHSSLLRLPIHSSGPCSLLEGENLQVAGIGDFGGNPRGAGRGVDATHDVVGGKQPACLVEPRLPVVAWMVDESGFASRRPENHAIHAAFGCARRITEMPGRPQQAALARVGTNHRDALGFRIGVRDVSEGG